MSEIDDLREQRAMQYQRIKSIHAIVLRVQKVCKTIEERFEREEKAYEDIDRKLAMLDGRFKVLEPGAKKHKEPQPLTREQILQIAKELGIPLEEGE